MTKRSYRRGTVWASLIALVGACFAGGYWLFVPTSGAVVLGQEPLVEQVRSGLSDRLRSEVSSSVHWWDKPTPAWRELVVDPSLSVEQVIALTESQSAFAQWHVVDECSSTMLWCATRSTSRGETLLATWSYWDSAGASVEAPLVFRVSEN